MFSKPAEGCGKWLTTKTTRRIAQSVKNNGPKKVKKKASLFKNNSSHIHGAVISNSSMSQSEIEMLSRVKQSKMDQFFKPSASNNKKRKSVASDQTELQLINKDKSTASKATSRSHQTLSTSLQESLSSFQESTIEEENEEVPPWDDYSYPYIQQIEDITFNSSCGSNKERDSTDEGVMLPFECPSQHLPEDQRSSCDNIIGEHNLSCDVDEPLTSPVAKRLKSQSKELSLGDNFTEFNSDSFNYSQWAKEQTNKSKSLQKSILIDHKSSKNNPISENEKNNEISESLSDILESEFHFTEWKKQQKEKCKELLHDRVTVDANNSCVKDNKEKLHKDSDNEENTPTDSNFRFTEWVNDQKSKCGDIHKSFDNLKSRDSKVSSVNRDESLSESEILCIPESELFIPETDLFEFNEKQRNEVLDEKSMSKTSIRKFNSQGKVFNMRASLKTAFKDVSNFCTKEGNPLKYDLTDKAIKTKSKVSTNTLLSQDSDPFQYTEWIQKQKNISKEIQNRPENFKLETNDEFWSTPVAKKKKMDEKKTMTLESKSTVLASDTDHDSDTDGSIFSQ